MKFLLPALAALALAACANTHPIKSVGAETYQLTHTLPKNAPNEGARNGLLHMAEAKCAEQDHAPFHKITEDVAVGVRTQTITLTFECKSVLNNSNYTGSYADKFSSKMETPFVAPLTPVPPAAQ